MKYIGKRMKELLSPKVKQWMLGLGIGLLSVAVLMSIIFVIYSIVQERDTNNVTNSNETESDTIVQDDEATNLNDCPKKKKDITHADTLNAILDNINGIAPYEPASGTRWTTERLEFVDNIHAYAIYSDSKSQRKVLIETSIPCIKTQLKRLAYFEPEDEGWKLVEGEDPFRELEKEKLSIYEFYTPKKEWLPLDIIEQLEKERKENEQQEQAKIDEEQKQLLND